MKQELEALADKLACSAGDAIRLELREAILRAYFIGRESLTGRDMVDKLFSFPLPKEDEDEDGNVTSIPAKPVLGGWRRDYTIPNKDAIVIYRTLRDSRCSTLPGIALTFGFDDDEKLDHIQADDSGE